MPTETTTCPDWMLVVSGKGVPLYWISASGERRDAADEPPPRELWHPEMKEAYPND